MPRVCKFLRMGIKCILEFWTQNKHHLLVQLPHLAVEKTEALEKESTQWRSRPGGDRDGMDPQGL